MVKVLITFGKYKNQYGIIKDKNFRHTPTLYTIQVNNIEIALFKGEFEYVKTTNSH